MIKTAERDVIPLIEKALYEALRATRDETGRSRRLLAVVEPHIDLLFIRRATGVARAAIYTCI